MKNQAFLSELQKTAWAMEAKSLLALFDKVVLLESKFPLDAIENSRTTSKSTMAIDGDTANIYISGVLMKTVPAFYRYIGIETTSYQDIQKDIAVALDNKDVENIILNIESPGGQVAGGIEATEAIYQAAQIKNVTAVIEDIGASGAYFLASQARNITANQMAWVGSMGVFMTMYDYSKMAENEGVKVVLVKSGEHKGFGTAGT